MPVTPFGKLIRTQRELLGEPGPPRSFRDVAARATAAGYPLSHGGVQDLETKELVNVPPTATLLGLSKGLTIPVEALVDAALESCGLARSRGIDPYWQVVTSRESRMTEREREAVRRQVAIVLRMHEGEPDDLAL